MYIWNESLELLLWIYSLGQKFRTFKWEFFSSLPGGDQS